MANFAGVGVFGKKKKKDFQGFVKIKKKINREKCSPSLSMSTFKIPYYCIKQ